MRSVGWWQPVWLGLHWNENYLSLAGIGGWRSKPKLVLLRQQPHLTHISEMLSQWLSSLPGQKNRYALAGMLHRDVQTLSVTAPAGLSHRRQHQLARFQLAQEGYDTATWCYDLNHQNTSPDTIQLVIAQRQQVADYQAQLGSWAGRLRLLTWPGSCQADGLPAWQPGPNWPPLAAPRQAAQAIQLAALGHGTC